MNTLRKVSRILFRLLAVLGFLVVFVSFTPIVTWWAEAYAGPIQQPKGDVLILLSSAADNEYGGISYSSYWRARQALAAWQTGGFKKIAICGTGDPGIINYLLALGIPREAFVIEKPSTSTRENALETARLMQSMPSRKVLLTSDFHMLRALAVFRKLKIEAAPMAVPDMLHATEQWRGRFPAFETMTTESVKIAYYKLRGWM
ncbi:MAG: YdcF family protein [Terracidiphilus sp.]